jgi:hypothetical protein
MARRTALISAMRNVLLVSISLFVGIAWLPAFADHTNPFNIPTQTRPAPPALSTPVAAPPPVAPPPPPVAPQAKILNIPILTPNISPRDTTNVAAPIARPLPPAEGGPPPEVAGEKPPADWNKPDLRFDFSNHSWIGFAEKYYVDKFGVIRHHVEPPQRSAKPTPADEKNFANTSAFEAGVSHTDELGPKALAGGAFIPTTSTKLEKIDDTALRLKNGAILVRAANTPVSIHTAYGGSDSAVTVGGRSIALVSLYDNKLIIMNLTDSCCGSVKADLPGKQSKQTLVVESGQILECYTDKQQPNSNWVAVNILVNDRVSKEHCLLVCRVNYIRALKKFQIAKVLPKQEMDRVLKTAAAMVSLGK